MSGYHFFLNLFRMVIVSVSTHFGGGGCGRLSAFTDEWLVEEFPGGLQLEKSASVGISFKPS